jgi:hypothetical protein
MGRRVAVAHQSHIAGSDGARLREALLGLTGGTPCAAKKPSSVPAHPLGGTAVRTSLRTSIPSDASRSLTSGHRKARSAERGRKVHPLRKVEGLVGCKSRGGSSPLRRTGEPREMRGFRCRGWIAGGFVAQTSGQRSRTWGPRWTPVEGVGWITTPPAASTSCATARTRPCLDPQPGPGERPRGLPAEQIRHRQDRCKPTRDV